MIGAGIWLALPSLMSRGPRLADDPFGPGGQDPDSARDAACDITASDSTCTPSVEPSDLPNPDFVDAGSAGSSGFGTVLVVILVLALLGAIAWFATSAVRLRGGSEDEEDNDDIDEDLDDDRDDGAGNSGQRVVDAERPPDRWRRAAAAHREAGRYRDAVRCEYRGLVGDLARAGIVDEIPGRTSGEERRQLAALAADVAPAFDAAADLFDRAWFDDDEVTVASDVAFMSAETVVLDHVLAGEVHRAATRRAGAR